MARFARGASPAWWAGVRRMTGGEPWHGSGSRDDRPCWRSWGPASTATLRSLPPPPDGVLYLIGDSTLKPKRGRKPPLGHFTRHGEHEPYQFGFELVLLIASWDRVRVPVALGLLDPQRRGHQN